MSTSAEIVGLRRTVMNHAREGLEPVGEGVERVTTQEGEVREDGVERRGSFLVEIPEYVGEVLTAIRVIQ